MRHFVGLFLLMLACEIVADDMMCYFCSDTSNIPGRNQCQTWVRTMNYYRKQFLDTKKHTTEKYVKNCTKIGLQGPAYCMIASIEVRKNVRSFIRDCTDGTEFFSGEINKYFQGGFVLQDNQTSCKYTGQGLVACVTMCDPTIHGNFCNGLVDVSSSTECLPNILMIMTLMCVCFIKWSKIS